jgi:Kdo2-lipid IVA lauroyltransferase/acyltransferase
VTRFGIIVLWLLHFLPFGLQARIGAGLGALFGVVVRKRRRITLINLRLCFPQLDEARREQIMKAHFRALGRSAIEHGILFWASKERLQRIVRLEGREHLDAVRGRGVILLAPHFVGLDMGGIRYASEFRGVSLYSRQKNPGVDALLLHARTRFGLSQLWSRQDGMRPLIKALREGIAFYYLPDMDLGARDSVFVPFFGVPAATVSALPRLARLADAVVVPIVTRQLPGAQGYVARFYPAWENFPSDNLEADVRRMNAFIEERVLEMPEQYWWLHRRFKTRPGAEAGFY